MKLALYLQRRVSNIGFGVFAWLNHFAVQLLTTPSRGSPIYVLKEKSRHMGSPCCLCGCLFIFWTIWPILTKLVMIVRALEAIPASCFLVSSISNVNMAGERAKLWNGSNIYCRALKWCTVIHLSKYANVPVFCLEWRITWRWLGENFLQL